MVFSEVSGLQRAFESQLRPRSNTLHKSFGRNVWCILWSSWIINSILLAEYFDTSHSKFLQLHIIHAILVRKRVQLFKSCLRFWGRNGFPVSLRWVTSIRLPHQKLCHLHTSTDSHPQIATYLFSSPRVSPNAYRLLVAFAIPDKISTTPARFSGAFKVKIATSVTG